MNARGLLMGGSLGILAAAVLIGGVGIAGTGAHHIDLLSPGNQSVEQGGGFTQSVSPATAVGQPSSQVISSGQPQRTTPSEGEPLFELLSPLVLAAVLGGAFYGLYTRRLERE